MDIHVYSKTYQMQNRNTNIRYGVRVQQQDVSLDFQVLGQILYTMHSYFSPYSYFNSEPGSTLRHPILFELRHRLSYVILFVSPLKMFLHFAHIHESSTACREKGYM